jgi:hypothetical protein
MFTATQPQPFKPLPAVLPTFVRSNLCGLHAFHASRCCAPHNTRSSASSAVINSYSAPFNHKPTSTNVAVVGLGEPEQLIEIQMFAVVD